MSSNPQYTAKDEGNDRKYFVMTPQIVWAECDSPYEYMLWNVVKMIAAEDGVCYVGTPRLARMCMMSTGMVSKCRTALLEKKLLVGRLVKRGDNSIWHLSIPDLWAENIAWRNEHHSLVKRISLKPPRTKSQRDTLSHSEDPLSPYESPLSPGETKKNASEEEPKDISNQQGQTLVSPTTVPSESDKNKAWEAELLDQSKRLNAQPQKHISAEERMAATRRASARGWANRASSGKTTRRAFEKELEKYGDGAPALRELHEQIETEFGLAPNWENVSKVTSWVHGLKELYIAANGDSDIVSAAGKKLRSDKMTMATPHSMVITAQSIAAERATAHTAPSARAVREYR